MLTINNQTLEHFNRRARVWQALDVLPWVIDLRRELHKTPGERIAILNNWAYYADVCCLSISYHLRNFAELMYDEKVTASCANNKYP